MTLNEKQKYTQQFEAGKAPALSLPSQCNYYTSLINPSTELVQAYRLFLPSVEYWKPQRHRL